jgi:hypothetical protein
VYEGFIQSATQWIARVLSQRIKRLKSEALPPLPYYFFMAWYLVKQLQRNFTFTRHLLTKITNVIFNNSIATLMGNYKGRYSTSEAQSMAYAFTQLDRLRRVVHHEACENWITCFINGICRDVPRHTRVQFRQFLRLRALFVLRNTVTYVQGLCICAVHILVEGSGKKKDPVPEPESQQITTVSRTCTLMIRSPPPLII